MLTPGGWGAHPHAADRATLPSVAAAEPARERPCDSRAWLAAGAMGLLGAVAVVSFLEARGWLLAGALLALAALLTARLLGSMRQLTALRHTESRRDPGTGLPNVRALLEHLEAWHRHRPPDRPLGLLVVSLAGVGEAGSVHGLEVGASVLAQLAQRLTAILPRDACVAVLAGRDLAVAVTADSDQHLDELGWQVRELASRGVTVGAIPVACGASVGVAVCEPDEAPELPLQRADVASRWAERAGTAGVQRYDSSMGSQVAYEVAVRAEIRDAVHRGELRVWCQPQLEIPSGRLVGVECLARWSHPTYGPVPPPEFVAAARAVGAAAELDARMVRSAVQQAAAWRAAGLEVARVAVNVEPTSLSAPHFIEAVASALRAARLPPATLEIELTEAVTAHDHAHARTVLWQLRALGVRLAVDDFGTGYSSLAGLHHLPVDAIKLDRELVSILPDDPVLASSTIALAQRLGLAVVAEGVETATELALLERAGCRIAQGYLLAWPMPAEQLAAWQRRRQASYRTVG